jgi:hypothetical protein
MSAALADDSPPAATPDPHAGVFLAAVESRRRVVLASLARMPQRDRVAELVFDVLTHVALNADTQLDFELVDSFGRRHDLDLQTTVLPREFAVQSLRDLLGRGDSPPGPALEALNALFTLGYASKIGPLDVVERRNFTLRVVAMLPGVERAGPYVLTDFLDVVLGEEDALRFWQIYVDRVAAEVGRRGAAPEVSTLEPWLLTRLLALHAEGPSPPRGSWLTLLRHVNRVLQAHRHRWRFIRHLAEGCHEPRMLLHLCTAPAMVEDAEVLPVFLVRGNGRLVSCALLTLQAYPDAHAAVDLSLAELAARPFPEIAPRLVEIYAQLHLFPSIPRGSALERLLKGIRTLTAEMLTSAPLDVLPTAVARDSRALRHLLLLVDVEPAIRAVDAVVAEQFLSRVLTTWNQTFTPSGVDHPLNDTLWRDAVVRAAVADLRRRGEVALSRFETALMGLSSAAEQWAQGDEARHAQLMTRFVGRFGSLWLEVCRALHRESEDERLVLSAYALLVRAYAGHEAYAHGTGAFGAAEYVVPSLFPDLLGATTIVEPGRLQAAAALVARVERSLRAGHEGEHEPVADPVPRRPRLVSTPPGQALDVDEPRARLIGLEEDEVEVRRAPPSRPPARLVPIEALDEEPALLRETPTRERPFEALGVVAKGRGGAVATVLSTYSGLALAREALDTVLRFVGVRTQVRLRLTDREVIVARATDLAGETLASDGWSCALTALESVRVTARLQKFYAVLGAGSLGVSAIAGGHLVFVGLRGADVGLAGLGAGAVLVGLTVDALLGRIARRHRETLELELRAAGRPDRVRVMLDARAGAQLLDAFMAHDAARREREQLQRWSRAEEPIFDAE